MCDRYCKIFLLIISFFLLGCSVVIGIPGSANDFSLIYKFDSVSVLFIFLTALLTPICMIVSWDKSCNYFFLFLALEIILVLFFSTTNLLIFYVLFELSLVPMFFIIGIWGSERRIYAAYKFFLYTFIASVPFLFALAYIYVHVQTLDMNLLSHELSKLNYETRLILWISFFISFAVKIPMWPFHTWLPDAHVEAPMSGSIMLAGVLIKLGGYGMLRVLLPLLPEISMYFRDFIFIVSIIAVIYTSIVAFAQEDMKKLIAYSSIAHMGFVTAGLFSNTKEGIGGAIFQMISHGIVSAALFLCVGLLYKRTHSRNISDYNGLANTMPIFSCVFVLFSMASIGLPGLSGFIGEFLIIIGLFENLKVYSILIVSGVVLGAIYMLSLCKKIIWGNSEMKMSDLSFVEIIAFVPLILITFIMGVAPNFFLNFIEMDKVVFNINLLK